MSTIFFTDGVLASSISSCDGVLREYVVSSETRSKLEFLKNSGARMGMIVQKRGQQEEFVEQALSNSGLLKFFDPQLVVYSDGMNEHSLTRAAENAREVPGRSFFVAQDCIERAHALAVGFDAAIPHPLLLSEVIDGQTLCYVRVSEIDRKLSTSQLSRFLEMPIVPFHLTPEDYRSIYLVTTNRTAELLRTLGFEVTIYGKEHNPQVTDLYLAHDDRRVPDGADRTEYTRQFLARMRKARFIVSFVDDAVLLALPPSVSIEEIHFPNALHGHNRRLLGDTALLTLLMDVPQRTQQAESVVASVTLSSEEVGELKNGITACTLEQFHARYVGDAPLDASGTKVESRHVLHRHNSLVTDALCRQLEEIGEGVMDPPRRYNFDYEGRSLSNIVADLPGQDPNSFVIISAHFDSTGAKSPNYKPESDLAPGADDDASGIAGVLAAAAVAVKLHREVGPLKRSLRFILFNAEEEWILGSQHYVLSHVLGTSMKVHAVFQMDMIGHTGGKAQKEFEVHVGCLANQQAEIDSYALAETIESVVAQVSTVLNSPQIYPENLGIKEFDPMDGRSDHTYFQVYGYRACVVNEDNNEGPRDTSPPHRENPDYHKTTDKKIDYHYAAEIARVVAAAAIQAAKG